MPNDSITNESIPKENFNNTFGPSSQIKKSTSQSETALTSHYVFFDKKVFDDFKNYCQQHRDDLSKNEFIKEYLTQEDINKLSQGSSNSLDDDVVMKLFIAINHTAGYAEKKDGDIGLKEYAEKKTVILD